MPGFFHERWLISMLAPNQHTGTYTRNFSATILRSSPRPSTTRSTNPRRPNPLACRTSTTPLSNSSSAGSTRAPCATRKKRKTSVLCSSSISWPTSSTSRNWPRTWSRRCAHSITTMRPTQVCGGCSTYMPKRATMTSCAR